MTESSITLAWELAYGKRHRGTAVGLIAALRECDPKALPRRYGLREPLKGVVVDDDFAGFFEACKDAAAEPFGGSVLFRTHRRFSWGYISFSDPRDPPPRPKAVGKKRVRVTLDFLGRDFETPGQADHLASLFTAVARALGAFFAIAYLETGLTKRGPMLYSYTRYPLPRSKYWLGVPQVPGWLVWFGPPYAEPLRQSCAEFISAEFDEGFLMRRSEVPVAIGALRDSQPVYPPDLTARLCEQTLSGRVHSIFPPEVTALDPRTFDGPAKVLFDLD